MTHFAPVVPLPIANVLKKTGRLGNYHLLLAHDVLAYPVEYVDTYLSIPYVHIILDNSVVELGHSLPIEDLVKAAGILRPNYLVIPDVMGDCDRSLQVAWEFTHDLMNRAPMPLMGVIQGKTVDEYLRSMRELITMPNVKALSVPRLVHKYLGTRIDMVATVRQFCPNHPIHLLGFSESLLDDVISARHPGVMGIDSAVPARAALDETTLTLDVDRDYGPRGNFWDAKGVTNNTRLILEMNHDTIRRWLDDTQLA